MLTSSQQAEASAALQPLYTAAGGLSVIPWADIIAILLPIIQGCLKPKTAADIRAAAESDSLRPAVRVACIEYGGLGWYRRNHGDAIAAAFKGYLPTASDDVLTAAID